ncbi:lytic murein transglycosylase [Rhizobium leguminosarum bv. viciae]|nr:lytic murein transglycosylase [Rhizobium leguminosarum bv. viciae]
MFVDVATPLCLAGHLPHKKGDHKLLCFSASQRDCRFGWPIVLGSIQPTSPLVGEMPGKAEGAAPSTAHLGSCPA